MLAACNRWHFIVQYGNNIKNLMLTYIGVVASGKPSISVTCILCNWLRGCYCEHSYVMVSEKSLTF